MTDAQPVCGFRTAHVLRDPLADPADPCAYVVAWGRPNWLHGGRHGDIASAIAHAARLERAPAADWAEWVRAHGGWRSAAPAWAAVRLAGRMAVGR